MARIAIRLTNINEQNDAISLLNRVVIFVSINKFCVKIYFLLGRHGSASLCREKKMAATYNVLADISPGDEYFKSMDT